MEPVEPARIGTSFGRSASKASRRNRLLGQFREGALPAAQIQRWQPDELPQRFRYNEIAQRYAVYSDLWRKKNRIREEGYRRPQDALLSVQGVRVTEREPEHKVYGVGHTPGTPGAAAAPAVAAPVVEPKPLASQCADARTEREQVQKLYQALTEAKKKSGEAVSGNLDSFTSFVQKKTEQIRKQYGCEAVEYSVEMQNGQVKLKAKAKT